MINKRNFHINKKPIINRERLVLRRTGDPLEWPTGKFKELKEYIQDLENEYGNYLSWELCYEWQGYEGCYYFVSYDVYETDEEMQGRIENEEEDLRDWEVIFNEINREKNLKPQQEKEGRRKQYNALKKEFQ